MQFAKWLVVLVLVLGAFSAAGAGFGEKNVLRGHLFYIQPTGDGRFGGDTIEAEDSFGLQVSYEVFFSDRLGVNVTVGTSDHDIDSRRGDTNLTPVTATVLFHLTPGLKFDVYVGPGLSYVFYGDLDRFSVDDDLAVSVEAGLDLPLVVEDLSLSFNVRYIDTSAEVQGRDLGIDPITVGVGVAYRF